MNPDEMSDDQISRAIGLTLAVIWTATNQAETIGNVCAISDRFVEYIETGEKPRGI